MENDGIEESVVAKSTGEQEEKDMAPQDATLYRVLTLKKKITKAEAGYQERENKDDKACVKCKFNLSVEKQCHIVEGEIDNDHGISDFFSPKSDGMLPGDIVWDFIKKTGENLIMTKDMLLAKVLTDFNAKTANTICIVMVVF